MSPISDAGAAVPDDVPEFLVSALPFVPRDPRVVPGLPSNARLEEHALNTGEIPRAGG